ncbi:hypothetical protein BST28_20595 [Mycolicibacter kumamotonensis]|uniref:Uncharacterized protein n=1 Tax=Mycolicibacter kumamotonensis TaxID=354243 RepID=A0A1X0DWD9_9MYCO|nr:hypothetical protein BST28_20595 [Mycolicibacter kumamotonensis]
MREAVGALVELTPRLERRLRKSIARSINARSGLAVSHAVQSRTGVSIVKVLKTLRPLRSATININGATQTFPPAIPDAERKILTGLGFKSGY